MVSLDKGDAALSCAHCGEVVSAADDGRIGRCPCCDKLRCGPCAARGVAGCSAPRPWRWRFARWGHPRQLDPAGHYLSYMRGRHVRVVDLCIAERVDGVSYVSSATKRRLQRGDREVHHAVLRDGALVSVAGERRTLAVEETSPYTWRAQSKYEYRTRWATVWGRDGRHDLDGIRRLEVKEVVRMCADPSGTRAYAAFAEKLVVLDSDTRRVTGWTPPERLSSPLMAVGDDGRLALADPLDSLVLLAAPRPDGQLASQRVDKLETASPLWVGYVPNALVVIAADDDGRTYGIGYRPDGEGWVETSERWAFDRADIRCSLDASLAHGGALLAVRAAPRQVVVQRRGGEVEATLDFARDVELVRFVDAGARLLVGTRGHITCWYVRSGRLVDGEPCDHPPWEASSA